MSEASCNIVRMNLENNSGLASPGSPVGLEENQATVGIGRGKWANELVAECRAAMAAQAAANGNPNPISPYASSSAISSRADEEEQRYDRRPTASAVFTRGDVIVMKRSESNDPNPLSLMPGNASTATIGSATDEQNYNNGRFTKNNRRYGILSKLF